MTAMKVSLATATVVRMMERNPEMRVFLDGVSEVWGQTKDPEIVSKVAYRSEKSATAILRKFRSKHTDRFANEADWITAARLLLSLTRLRDSAKKKMDVLRAFLPNKDLVSDSLFLTLMYTEEGTIEVSSLKTASREGCPCCGLEIDFSTKPTDESVSYDRASFARSRPDVSIIHYVFKLCQDCGKYMEAAFGGTGGQHELIGGMS